MINHSMLAYKAPLKHPILVMEIVGPAGAGKTTILSALSKHDEKIRPIYGFRHKRYIPLYVKHAILLSPFLLLQYAKRRWYSPKEVNRMIRLKATRQILERQMAHEDLPILLDQGPIYTLSVLAEFGSQHTKNQDFIKWWEKTLQEWSETLALIVWVDAPDEVLLERIHTRSKQHVIKEKSNQEAIDFLGRFRSVYQQTIEKLKATGDAQVICYDTSQCSMESIVDTLLTTQALAAAKSKITS
ncbi:MAG: AAA family ATPase [Gammaproteobacteria bacterium]